MSRNKFFMSGSNIACFTFYIHLWPIYWLSLVLVSSVLGGSWQLQHKGSDTMQDGYALSFWWVVCSFSITHFPALLTLLPLRWKQDVHSKHLYLCT
jgi:predicted CDP-diglyceride synthetase/phosphatidate cytidylyltransferase